MTGRHYLISQRCLLVQMRVPSLTIIENLDIFKDAGSRCIPALVILMVHQLGFQGMEKAFGHRVIPAVSLATHGAPDVVRLEHGLIVSRSILAALVGM